MTFDGGIRLHKFLRGLWDVIRSWVGSLGRHQGVRVFEGDKIHTCVL